MTDVILLEGIQIPAALGVTAAERKMRRPVLLDLEIERDLTVAGRTDRIGDTGLGEDHFFAGLRTPLGPRLFVETGYLMQFRERPGSDLVDHTLVLGFAVTTPQLAEIW